MRPALAALALALAAPLGACAPAPCAAGESPDDGAVCIACPPGNVALDGANCVPFPNTDPALRDAATVCAVWLTGRVRAGGPLSDFGRSGCGTESLPQEVTDDLLRRWNAYRFLAGVPPVVEDAAGRNLASQCATTLRANPGRGFDPDATWLCHSDAVDGFADGALMYRGFVSAAGAIDYSMAGAADVPPGLRTALLRPRLARSAIGVDGQQICFGVRDTTGPPGRTWTSVPGPGPQPLLSALSWWSFESESMTLSDADITVVRRSDGAPLAMTRTFPMVNVVFFLPDAWTPLIGDTYGVTVHSPSAAFVDVVYEVTLVGC